MKIVDENYKYDELEGFEPFDPKTRPMRNELIQLDIHGRQFIFSKLALDAMGNPDYVTIRINAERKLILFRKGDYKDPMSLRLRPRQKTNKVKSLTESQALVRRIEEVTKKDLKVVNILCDGTKSRSVRDAVIFDLDNVRIIKKRAVGIVAKKAGQ